MMKPLLLLIFLVCSTDANIAFPHAPLLCDPILPAFQGCFRGQYCSHRGTCEVDRRHGGHGSSTRQSSVVPKPKIVPVTPLWTPGPVMSTDGEDDNCDTQDIHVDAGKNQRTKPFSRSEANQDICRRRDQGEMRIYHNDDTDKPLRTSRNINFSSKRWTNKARDTNSTQALQQQVERPEIHLNVTIDGLCGPSNGNTICGNWTAGSCCSAYGFCGNTSSHCGAGCQSGDCDLGTVYEMLSHETYQPGRVPGEFRVVGQSGVPAMSAALLMNGRVVFVDKIENYTQLVLENGQYAYSAEYDPETNTVAPLAYKTNSFCSGGVFLDDGRLINLGGNAPLPFLDPTIGDGFRGIRYLSRPLDTDKWDGMPWDEPGYKLSTNRWYASAQVLRDGTVFVVSGSLNGFNPSVSENNNPTYEFLDKDGIPYGESILFPILEENQPYYMYPFLHLLKDGNVFVFVSRSSEVFDAYARRTVKKLPDLPGDYRTYPNTGGSVLLPLRPENGWEPEVMICGGGAYVDITSPSDPSCGRIKPLAPDPEWELELMPAGRVMVEGMMLPDGTMLWINGCSHGAQGFGIAKDPAYDALIYYPEAPAGHRWNVGATSEIARMYHSVALLLLDGTVMVAGSNPVEQPILVPNPDNEAEAYVTEFRVEIYTPHYFLDGKKEIQPYDVNLPAIRLPADSRRFIVNFKVYGEAEELKVVLYHGGFATHSLHMGHRMLYLEHEGFRPGRRRQKILATMPPDNNVAPPGPYVIYIVVDGVPSVGQFVKVEIPQ
ncbi:hypothetical protein AJ79_04145 [Helicocarpus griseus UAMH5409]|uniref:Chitin-binding type-1 domain-containing protein n=1 Tax=Helicocarpus griseus UAMH5409 TaxID=1447875 RepID=A0A2B7XVW3_9EURO|nr:hypothetical protein AJ79_04145 [Helicocarpus griseus UAMH5409]